MKTKHGKILQICLMSVMFAVITFVCRPVFDLNDDVTMRSILSGSYTGKADGHAVYMKYPLTGILSCFYGLVPGLPWMELFFGACLIWAAVEIVAQVAIEKVDYLWKMLCGILFVIPFFWSMHYTIIAAVLAGTAVFLLNAENKSIQVVLFWLLAWMVRSQVAYLALPFLGVALLWNLVGGQSVDVKGMLRNIGKLCGMLFAGWLICVGIHSYAYSDEAWKAFLEYNEVRTELYDYTDIHSTDYYTEHYEQYGMTRGEFYVINSYNTILDDSVDGEKLQSVVDKIQQRMSGERGRVAWIKECVKQYLNEIRYGDGIYVYLWLMLCGLLLGSVVLAGNGMGFIILGCYGCGRSLIWIYLIYRGRFPERVVLSLYIIEILLLIGMFLGLSRTQNEGWLLVSNKIAARKEVPMFVNVCVRILLVAGVVGMLGSQIREDYGEIKNKNRIQKEWSALTEYCEKQEDKLYLLDVFSAAYYGGLLYEEDSTNLMLAGGWMSATPHVLEKFEKMSVADGGEALYEDTRTVFLADKTRDLEELQAYLTERFGECSLLPVTEIICSESKVFVEYRLVHQ